MKLYAIAVFSLAITACSSSSYVVPVSDDKARQAEEENCISSESFNRRIKDKERLIELSFASDLHLKGDPVSAAALDSSKASALLFDGIDDYLQADRHEAFEQPIAGLTVEALVKPLTLSGSQPLLCQASDSCALERFALLLDDGIPVLRLSDGRRCDYELRGNRPLRLYQWQHLAAVWRPGAGSRIYVDDQIVADSILPLQILNERGNAPLRIAGNGDDSLFHGGIAEAHLWTKALNQEELSSDRARLRREQRDNLLGYWNFNRGEADGIFRSSGDGLILRGNSIELRGDTLVWQDPQSDARYGLHIRHIIGVRKTNDGWSPAKRFGLFATGGLLSGMVIGALINKDCQGIGCIAGPSTFLLSALIGFSLGAVSAAVGSSRPIYTFDKH